MRFSSKEFITREDVRQLACPDCKAPAGERCVTHVGVERESNHLARLVAFKRARVEAMR